MMAGSAVAVKRSSAALIAIWPTARSLALAGALRKPWSAFMFSVSSVPGNGV
jgi:hypothetical protein